MVIDNIQYRRRGPCHWNSVELHTSYQMLTWNAWRLYAMHNSVYQISNISFKYVGWLKRQELIYRHSKSSHYLIEEYWCPSLWSLFSSWRKSLFLNDLGSFHVFIKAYSSTCWTLPNIILSVLHLIMAVSMNWASFLASWDYLIKLFLPLYTSRQQS